MDLNAYLTAASKNDIYSGDEARNAIEFALDLLDAEKLHLEATEPQAYQSISRLEAARSELSSLRNDLEDYMD